MRLLVTNNFYSFSSRCRLPVTPFATFSISRRTNKTKKINGISYMHSRTEARKWKLKQRSLTNANPCPKKCNHKTANTMRRERAVISYFASNQFDSLLMKFFFFLLLFVDSRCFTLLPCGVVVCALCIVHYATPSSSHLWKSIFF